MPPEHLGAAFTVIQLSPPPAQDERVNVGVIAADEGRAAIRLLTSWRRAQHFSGGDLAGVRDVLERLQERISASTRDGFTLEDLHRLVSRDRGVIQFAPLRESTESVESLVTYAAAMYLVDHGRPDAQLRGRREVKALVKARTRAALRLHVLNDEAVERLLRSSLRGVAAPHAFDAVIGNGRAVGVLHGVSYEEGPASAQFERSEALAFRVFDVREKDSDIKAGIFALAPLNGATPQYSDVLAGYERARTILESVGATILDEVTLPAWLDSVATVAAQGAAEHPGSRR